MVTWKDFVKKAQMFDMGWPAAAVAFAPNKEQAEELAKIHNPTSTYSKVCQHGDLSLFRGAAKGVKETVPQAVDFLAGNTLGLAGGFGSALGGGSWSDFHKGFYDSKGLVRDYVSNPIRKAEMAMGGTAIRDAVDKGRAELMADLRRDAGGDVQRLQDLDDVEEGDNRYMDGMEGSTQILLSYPLYTGISALGATPGSAIGKPLVNFANSRNLRWLQPIANRVGPYLDSAAIASEGGAHASLGQDEYNKAEQDMKQKYQMTPEQAMAELRRRYDAGMGTPEWRQRVSERFGW